MLPNFIIIKILLYNHTELPKYRCIFTQTRIKIDLQKILSSEEYKWDYLKHTYNYEKLVKKCKNCYNYNFILSCGKVNISGDFNEMLCKSRDVEQLLYSDDLDTVKYGLQLGATKINRCMYSNNIDVVKYAVKHGADNYHLCIYTFNIDVILFGLRYSN